ncbi:S-adenosyl-L-methionine-dependent methyltransferase [Amylocarpus encephaloides]|uniref:S-adenosyl-L-methionine-dependent methyltransferase n=1 Tax=Amylocarpus encephaloides TaxID=45428 RepID=A0A9P7YM34_9HELO|nr:S-adenosyl-L-methionine-dependent methyltransferase [Amylocarpus encephaloides]
MVLADKEQLINKNDSLQRYYASLESRIGYRLVLGGTRHFGYYKPGAIWPFPINRALRAMEDHIFDTLGLQKGSQVLDAGCGVGDVAIHLAQRGLRVTGIDIIDHHIKKATRNIQNRGWQHAVTVQKMDYHHLDALEENSFDGVYTCETFVHAIDPEVVLGQFYKVMKPGGVVAFYEYDHANLSSAPKNLKDDWEDINKFASMPTHAMFDQGVLESMLEKAGFVNIVVQDLTPNIKPMIIFFYLLAFIPSLIVRLFGLQRHFINTLAGVSGWRSEGYSRYIAVSAKKPADVTSDDSDAVRERKPKFQCASI